MPSAVDAVFYINEAAIDETQFEFGPEVNCGLRARSFDHHLGPHCSGWARFEADRR